MSDEYLAASLSIPATSLSSRRGTWSHRRWQQSDWHRYSGTPSEVSLGLCHLDWQVSSLHRIVDTPSVHFVPRQECWGSRRIVVLGKNEILRAVAAAADYRPMSVRLESGCGLASSVDQEHDCAAYVRMGARLDSLYGPANSADREQEYAVVVAGTEKRFPKRSPLGRVLRDHLSKVPPHLEGDRARSAHLQPCPAPDDLLVDPL